MVWVALAWIGLGGIAGSFSSWWYVKKQVAKAEYKIRQHVLISDYDESEKDAIIGYLEDCLNDIN